MAWQKLTFFYSAGKAGWTETWYKQGDNADAVIPSAKLVAAARVTMLATSGNNARLEYIRISDDDIFGDARVVIGPGGNKVDKADFPADVAWTGVLVRVEAGSKYRRMFIMRGWADAMLTGVITEQQLRSIQVEVDQWFRVVKQEALLLKVWDKEATNPEFKVASVAQAGGLITVSAPGLTTQTSDLVIIRGFVKTTNLNGVKRCSGPGANSANFLQSNEVIPLLLTGKERIRIRKRAYIAVTDAIALRTAHHDTGRPFDSPRGRRRK